MNYHAMAQARWHSAHLDQWITAAIVTRKGLRVNSISPDTLTQLRGAWRMYDFIRAYHPCLARQLRREYGYSRFYELYLGWMRYEFSADECIDHLTSDLSNAGMVMQIVDTNDPRPEWERKSYGIYKTVKGLAEVSYGAPAWFTEWAKQSRDLFERNGYKL